MQSATAKTALQPVEAAKGAEALQVVEPLVAHLDREFARRQQERLMAVAQVRAQLQALEHDLLAAINWAALRPAVGALRAKLNLLALQPSRGVIVAFAVASFLGIGWLLHSTPIAIIGAAILSVGGCVALFRYQLHGLREAVVVKLARYRRWNDAAELPFEFDFLADVREGPPTVQLHFFVNITEPRPGSAIAVLFDRRGEVVGLIGEGAQGWRVQAMGGRPLRPAGPPVSGGLDSFAQREAELRKTASAQAETEAAAGCILRKGEINRVWARMALATPVRDHVLKALVHFAYGDAASPRGILLKGPPGTGKSMLAHALADSLEVTAFKRSVGQLKGEHIGESGNHVRRLWAEAREAAPALIFIDECEGAFPARGVPHSDSFTNELVQTFLTEWDGIGAANRVLVVAATNRPELLDDAVMSRFTDVVELTPPQAEDRAELVQKIACQLELDHRITAEVAPLFAGMSGREVRNSLLQARRLAAPAGPETRHFREAAEKLRGKAATRTEAGARWDSLVLPEPIKRQLFNLCQMLRQGESLQQKGIPVPTSLLLYGPPGTGKTQIARTLANEAGLTFIARSTAELKAQYLGHAATKVAQTFESARTSSPCILFIDEIDALTPVRGSRETDSLQAEALTQLLQEMDGVNARPGFVFVMAATNRVEGMDSAVLSRFHQRLEIGLPDLGARAALLGTLLDGRPVDEAMDLEAVARRCAGYSGRDLRELVVGAFQRAVDRTLAEGADVGATTLRMMDLLPGLKSMESGTETGERPIASP